MNAERFDILVVGGGMVGASLACVLAQDAVGATLRIALVESFPLLQGEPKAYQPSFDARSTALGLGSKAVFARCGLWDAIARHAQPISRIHVSDRGRFGSTRMDAEEEGLEALGYIVENQWLGAVLHRRLREIDGLTVIAPASVESVRTVDGGGRAVVRGGEGTRDIEAGLVVVADGARSGLARSLGIESSRRDYEQVAVIANIAHRRPHAGQAFERFTDQGPVAMLPLPEFAAGEPRSALVWVMPPDLAEEVRALSDADFLRRLQQRFGYRLGRLERCGARHAYPLQLVKAQEQVRSHVVVLGNAAHALHPVAGQGFNLSLRDVDALAMTLLAAHRAGEPIGALPVLQRFLAAQRADQARTIGFSDLLPRVFGSSVLPLVLLRDLGLIGLDVMPPLRSLLVRQATGLVNA